MSEENALTLYDPAQIVALINDATGALDLPLNAEPVEWKSLREAVDPQGELIKARDLVGKTFTLKRVKPFESAYPEGREVVYWVVAVDQDGILFNTVLGGKAVCETLDKLVALNQQLVQAYHEKDETRMRELMTVGAGRPITVTLQKKAGGKYNGYFTFD